MSLLAIPSGTSSNASGFYPYAIDGSLRFNDDDSAYLTRTPSTTTNRRTYTYSWWFKRANISDTAASEPYMLTITTSNADAVLFESDERLRWTFFANTYRLTTTQVFRDPSAWYHLVLVADTTNATESDRLKIYVNGERITAFDVESYPTQNYDTKTNVSGNVVQFGQSNTSTFDGYMADINFVDGLALDADDFGETKSGVWVPKEYSGSYGTNGFHLEFAGNANDSSGNGNNFTANNITSDDYVLDSPTNNFCTMNTIDPSSWSFADGNLTTTRSSSDVGVRGTMALPETGKWYFECTQVDAGAAIGIQSVKQDIDNWSPAGADHWIYDVEGDKHNDSTETAYGSAITDGDVVQVAVDMDNSKIFFGLNNVWQGSGNPVTGVNAAFTNVSGSDLVPCANRHSGAADLDWNFGQLGFTYTPPTDYLALSTANLPDPAIDPAQGESPEDYFNTVLYTGNGTAIGSGGNAITGVGFQPDWVWIKERSGSASHGLYDAVRGVTEQLESDTTAAETTESEGLTAFGTDGFTVGSLAQVNTNTDTYVAWNWKANGSGVSNTDGTITSDVSANTDVGFSIITWVGNATAGATIGHGLDQAPDLFITKYRAGSTSWGVYHSSLGATKLLNLDSTNAASTTSSAWNNTEPTDSVITLGTNASTNNPDMVGYAFHSVEGFSKFGSYTGGSSPLFAYTGFRPAFVLIKRATTGTSDWILFDDKRDGYNGSLTRLYPNEPDAESAFNANRQVQFMANGFEVTGAPGAGDDGNRLLESGTYIFIAFAANPFKYSTAF